jgi:hypothetical protein
MSTAAAVNSASPDHHGGRADFCTIGPQEPSVEVKADARPAGAWRQLDGLSSRVSEVWGRTLMRCGDQR